MMLFAILIAFIVCAVPFQVTKLFELFRKDRSESVCILYIRRIY
jgi:hypothetical protein